MPKAEECDKEFPIFSSMDKKRSTQQHIRAASGAELSVASPTEPAPANQATMEQILAEIKSLASWVNGMDESVGSRLDGTLSEIKISITSVEDSLSSLSNRASQLEKRAEEAEERITAAEDHSDDHSFV